MGSRIDAQRPVLGIKGWVSAEADAGYHHHPRGQLAYAAEGMLKVFTQAGSWVIPSTQAVWIPGEMEHAVNAEIDAEIRHIFIDPSCLDRLPHECSIVEMSSLLRELIMRVADYGTDYELEGPASRVCAVILDELQGLKPSLLHLPGAKDRRLQRVMKAMIEAPSAETGLDHWARYAGASERTLARLFSRETGMSFQKWRKQLLLQEAVFRLGRGESVLDVSLELGYRSPSAFVAMFRKALGKPPGQYFKERA
jgi:AraC-like DNA-binding protein